ncbi:uncharacterized protein BDZ99DRAFT_373114, partial [Mytilinidion resinicola]
ELLDLCYDVLIRIIEELNPEDLAACSKCSHGFNAFIKENRRIFRTLYLKNFDDPRRIPGLPEPQWETELPKIIMCKKILMSDDVETKTSHFGLVTSVMSDLLHTASKDPDDSEGSSLNLSFLAVSFKNPDNKATFLAGSSMFERAGLFRISVDTLEPHELRQLTARLHCYHGTSSPEQILHGHTLQALARSRVYDLRNYTSKTFWGPYLNDGTLDVDWEMVEAIQIILSRNFRAYVATPGKIEPSWARPFAGVARSTLQSSYVPLPYEPEIPLEAQDPYAISGNWIRIVCFLDYNDLFAFNFGGSQEPPEDQPRSPLHAGEATRLIRMIIKVSSIEPPTVKGKLPNVNFEGKSQAIDASWDANANSRIRGTVSMTPSGEVRWTTISIFSTGEERWRSESIQVGGVRSERGVIGTWFDKDFDPHGPAGPTAFWKYSDET